MSIKRITYIHQHYQLPHEGGALRGWEFTRRLAQDGYEVTVIRGRPRETSGIYEGVKVVGVGTRYANNMSVFRRILAFLQFTLKSTAFTVRTPADLVFATSTPLTVTIPGLIASALKRIPFVFEVRDLWPEVPIQLGYIKNPLIIKIAEALERVSYRRAERVIALSTGMRDGVLKVSKNSEVFVVPNAADIQIFESFENQRESLRHDSAWGNKPVVFYAGSFGDIYNIPWLVQLAANCKEFADFQIVGDGRSMAESRELALSLGLDPNKLLPGSMNKLEVAKKVVAADFCISSVMNHPSLEAASINKVFDAMAAGRPILFNHDGWLEELCVAEGAGWRLDNDPAIAANQIEKILRHQSQICDAAKKSRKLADRFSRENLYVKFKSALLGESEGIAN